MTGHRPHLCATSYFDERERELLERDDPLERDPLERDPPLRELLLPLPLRELLDREPPLRELLDRDDPPDERDDVERELLLRDELDVPDLRARVEAPFFAAVLRLAAARLRVAAPFLAAAERDFDELPPLTLLSSSSARPRSSSTVPRTSFGEFSPASAIARATRLRIPLSRSLLNRSLSRGDLAIRSSSAGCRPDLVLPTGGRTCALAHKPTFVKRGE
jgi:hypothetical protein